MKSSMGGLAVSPDEIHLFELLGLRQRQRSVMVSAPLIAGGVPGPFPTEIIRDPRAQVAAALRNAMERRGPVSRGQSWVLGRNATLRSLGQLWQEGTGRAESIGTFGARSRNDMPTRKKKAFIHSAAVCESPRIGNGTRIWAFAHVPGGESRRRHAHRNLQQLIVAMSGGCDVVEFSR